MKMKFRYIVFVCMSIALVAGTSFSMELKEKNIVEEHPPYNSPSKLLVEEHPPYNSPSKLSREKYQLYNNQNNVLI
ncbi:hypothetical protein ACS47_03225 [Bacillus cereus]|uniref:Phosphatase RapH inhibitor n=5 Tax=Bacillaceae TaxID=186817 RepID=A0A5M9GR82_9BACI|nr:MULTISPECIES: hypothetical protein [Bacillus]ACJ78546.1 hypothetical protein BCAH187_A0422 [Bacillus cereus AH187]AYY30197.1 hypothetical protein EGX95_28320 [Bacillus sp. FDAARGOS_527]EJP85487.1 hypothetical protein IAU_04855 [Bacillus cereus IS075]EJR04453.1 hypothetical protein II7_05531 [Bacillus cereus MSX-A12]EOO90994.1 hypothetical protein IGS_01908 [Bacillus cereus IS845/00]EOO97569.1 hypothetical protein IGQ_01871 [Bacillus cereus IS195]KLA03840.1 hypothetical protein B4153_5931 